MSRLLDHLIFFKRNVETFSGEHDGVMTHENRAWEDSFCQRW